MTPLDLKITMTNGIILILIVINHECCPGAKHGNGSHERKGLSDSGLFIFMGNSESPVYEHKSINPTHTLGTSLNGITGYGRRSVNSTMRPWSSCCAMPSTVLECNRNSSSKESIKTSFADTQTTVMGRISLNVRIRVSESATTEDAEAYASAAD
jgi:hypothetical protein